MNAGKIYYHGTTASNLTNFKLGIKKLASARILPVEFGCRNISAVRAGTLVALAISATLKMDLFTK